MIDNGGELIGDGIETLGVNTMTHIVFDYDGEEVSTVCWYWIVTGMVPSTTAANSSGTSLPSHQETVHPTDSKHCSNTMRTMTASSTNTTRHTKTASPTAVSSKPYKKPELLRLSSILTTNLKVRWHRW